MANVSSSNSLGENVPKLRFPGFEGEWDLINISELLDFQNGINTDSDKYGSGIKYISVSDILNNPYILYDDIKGLVDINNSTLEHYKVEYGDIVFQRSSETFEDIGHANVYLDNSRPATFGGFVIRGKKKGSYIPFFFKNLLDTPNARKATTRMGAGAQHYNIGQNGLSRIALYFPKIAEQEKIANLFMILNKKIQLQKELIESLKLYKRGLLAKLFPQKGESVPQYRFEGFTDDWKQRKLGEQYVKVTEKNDLSFGTEQIISVANMYFKGDTAKSDDDYMRTYNVMRLGDIAFEGNKSKNYTHGRFVENTIGDGIVSHVFDVFRPIAEYDLSFWKYLINYEGVMGRIMARCTKASTMMTNLVADDFLKESVVIPCIEEQKKIGIYLEQLDSLIIFHQRKYSIYQSLRKSLLQQMFI